MESCHSRRQPRRPDVLLAVDEHGGSGVGFGDCFGKINPEREGQRERANDATRRVKGRRRDRPISVPSLCSSVREWREGGREFRTEDL